MVIDINKDLLIKFSFYFSIISFFGLEILLRILGFNFLLYLPESFQILLDVFTLVSIFILFFWVLIRTYQNQQWLHFWLSLLTFFYIWIYYLFYMNLKSKNQKSISDSNDL